MAKAVIVYLSRTQDIPVLLRSLSLLCKNLSVIHKYPIVIFHDDINKINQANIRLRVHQNVGFIPNIRFEEIRFQHPGSLDANMFDSAVPLTQFGMGYRHMCRFFSGEFYSHPAMTSYQYYWRLDSDSYLLSKIDFDPFEYMEKNQYQYAFMAEEDKDNPIAAIDFWKHTKQFLVSNNIKSDVLEKRLVDGEWDYSLYYNNFQIGNFDFWRSDKYQNFYQHMDKTNNFYYKRWGDHIMQWMAVKMFLPEDAVWCVKNIAYQHNDWVKNLACLPNKQPDDDTMSFVEGTDTTGRRGRLLYAINRYRQTGIDGVNWND